MSPNVVDAVTPAEATLLLVVSVYMLKMRGSSALMTTLWCFYRGVMSEVAVQAGRRAEGEPKTTRRTGRSDLSPDAEGTRGVRAD